VATQPTITSPALAVTVIAILTACDPGSPKNEADRVSPSASATHCAGAQISFGPEHKTDVLTAIAPAVTITSPSGGPLDTPSQPVRRYRAEVVAESDVPQAEIYQAFVVRSGGETLMPEFGEVASVDPGALAINGAGRFVRYEGVSGVEATFSYSCGKIAGRGTVWSWSTPISGVLSCDDKAKPSEPIHEEATALACTD
jgi:hypothetical protein